jgi:hypothetical protein
MPESDEILPLVKIGSFTRIAKFVTYRHAEAVLWDPKTAMARSSGGPSEIQELTNRLHLRDVRPTTPSVSSCCFSTY